MLNQTVIVGRLTSDIETKKMENGKKVSNITLAVPRSYKNENGEYDTDFIKCTLWNNIAENTAEYCHKGDVVGIKGRIQVNNAKDKEGNERMEQTIVAEKVTFLSSAKNNDNHSNENELEK